MLAALGKAKLDKRPKATMDLLAGLAELGSRTSVNVCQRISGFAKCYNGPFALPSAAAQITIRLRPTGETRTVSVNGFGYYGADFYTVPVAGGWADESINCPFTGGWRYARAAFMYRPPFGNDIVGYNMTA